MPDFNNDKLIAANWARTILRDPNVRILDVETSGLGAAEILQIGVTDTRGTALMDTLVRPNWHNLGLTGIPAEATAINHITDAMVENAPTLTSLLPELSVLIHNKIVVVYNVEFEYRILEGCLTRRGTADAATKWVRSVSGWDCAMGAYAKWYGDWNPTYRSYRWQKLGDHAPMADHSALSDCRAVLQLMNRMADSYDALAATIKPISES